MFFIEVYTLHKINNDAFSPRDVLINYIQIWNQYESEKSYLYS